LFGNLSTHNRYANFLKEVGGNHLWLISHKYAKIWRILISRNFKLQQKLETTHYLENSL